MGQVNISKLHESFVSVGYSAESKLLEDICLATVSVCSIEGKSCPNRVLSTFYLPCQDLPTFSQKMDQLIQDNRCIQLSQPVAVANNQF